MHIGIDLGSRTIKFTALRDGVVVDQRIAESGFDPHAQAAAMLEGLPARHIVATGYGRHLAQRHFAGEVITEIKAHALGSRHLFPACRTVVDVGGQDSKVIALDATGRVVNFQMNDKCAAGTGRFLEIMAAVLGYALAEFGQAALAADGGVTINSMCTVFAESEVISLKNRGVPASDIARGVHQAVVNRLIAMLNRLGHGELIVFSGGVAKNPCIVHLLQGALVGATVMSAPEPDLVGALGAALHAAGSHRS